MGQSVRKHQLFLGLCAILAVPHYGLAGPTESPQSPLLDDRSEDRQRYRERRAAFEYRRHDGSSVRLDINYPGTIGWPPSAWIDLTRSALEVAEARLGLPLRDPTLIHFDLRPDSHNGLATVIPNERIIVHLEPPEIEASIAFSRDYLRETLVHEFGHMIVLQQRRGLFTPLNYVFGTSARPIGLWPKWMHEGLAVWTEAASGGRPGSGLLEFEKRKFAEATRRRGSPPLSNSDLDGTGAHQRTEPGDIPYHFGYLFLKHWADQQRDPTPFRRFVETSSRSLGLSFRITFRELGTDLDSEFEKARTAWSRTPLPQGAKPLEIASSARGLVGPFANEDGVAWIEVDGSSFLQGPERVVVARDPSGKARSFRWKPTRRFPLQAYPLRNRHWIVLARAWPEIEDGPFISNDRRARRVVLVLNEKGDFLCKPSLPPRIREIDAREGRLSWTRLRVDGYMTLESASFDAARCALGPVRELVRGRSPFERLSAPWVGGETWAVSRSRGRDSYAEEILIDGTPVEADRPLSQPYPASALCGRGCWLVHEFSRERWAPALIRLGGARRGGARQATLSTLTLETGSFRAVVDPQGRSIWARTGYWEEDRLASFDGFAFESSTRSPPGFELSTGRSTGPSTAQSIGQPRDYGPWPSIWPHFWVPAMEANARGLVVLGQTFYEDLSGAWSGATTLGYDTSMRRPMAATSLRKSDLGLGPFRALDFRADYSPTSFSVSSTSATNLVFVQDRWSVGSGLSSTFAFASGWNAETGLGATYLRTYETGPLKGLSLVIPTLQLAVASPKGLSPRLPESRGGFLVTGRLRQLASGPETYSTLRADASWRRLGFGVSAEHGWMARENFPNFYFLWGGLPTIALYDATFLTRGFAPEVGVSSHALRLAAQSTLALWQPNVAVSWNRLRLRNVDLGVVGEAVTSSIPGTRYVLGRQYFPTVGAQLDLHGVLFQYVAFRMSHGVFYGFGPFGGTRYTLSLRSSLEI